MKTITTTYAALMLTLAASIPFAATAQNLIVNGSFELGPFQPRPDGFEDLTVGSTAMPGWTVITATINRGINGNIYGIAASDGALLLDLTAFDNIPPHGGVTQTIFTSPGQSYHLSLDLGTYQSDPRFVGPIRVDVSAGDEGAMFIHNPVGTGNQWATYGFDFTADSASTLISIRGISGIAYIGLDNVVVVPEPSFLVLATLGVAIFTGSILRRKRLRI